MIVRFGPDWAKARILRGAVSCAVGFMFGGASQAIVRIDSVPDQALIDAAAAFPSVGKLQGSYGTRTATLISDRWILTAGHNFPKPTEWVNFILNGETYVTSNWKQHPKFNINDITSGYDFCVAQLDRRVTTVEPSELFLGAPNGLKGTIVGYGAKGVASTGSTVIDGNKRAGTNTIEFWSDYPNVLWTDLDSGSAADNPLAFLGSLAAPTERECGVAVGDSGGALLAVDRGTVKIVGVTSFNGRLATGNGTTYGSLSGFSNVATAARWIVTSAREIGRIDGHVEFRDFVGSVTTPVLEFELRRPGSPTALQSTKLGLDTGGRFSLTTSLRGDYDLAIKGPLWLRKTVRVRVLDSGCSNINVRLLGGDCDDDNTVSTFDYNVLSHAYGTVAGDPNWDARADLDGDGFVSVFDYNILAQAYGFSGDP